MSIMTIVNDIKNFVFGSAKASIYGLGRRRKQKIVISFTISIIRNYGEMEHKFEKEQRWEDLAGEYQTMLYRIAFSNMKNRADAEDVVQEAFLRYMKDEKTIQNKEHEKAWLIRTTIHICMDILKSSWHRKTVALDEASAAQAKNVWLPYQSKDDSTLEAVLQLPVHYRNPIWLFYYEDYSIQEIAVVLNEKEGTVKTRLRRGREEIRKILCRNC